MATRAELLKQCQERGFKATGWSKGRMEQELGLEPAAPQVATSAPERDATGIAQAKRALRTGPCSARRFSGPCQCPSWESGWTDSHGLLLCGCGHTQDSHETATEASAA